VDRTIVEQHLEAAGPGGRLAIRFRDRLVPRLDPNGEAVYEQFPDGTLGQVVHVEDQVGISRTISAAVVQIIDNHVALGVAPGSPIERLIAFADIEVIRPDPADHDASTIRAGEPVQAQTAPAPAPEVAQ
jgi:hypothetical protein